MLTPTNITEEIQTKSKEIKYVMDNINSLTRIIRGILRLRGRLRTRRGGAALRVRDSLSRRACSETSNVLAESSKRNNNITGEFKVES